MEAGSKHLDLNDDERSLSQEGPLPMTHPLAHLEDLNSHLEQPQPELNIQIKYYQEFKKIHLTAFKLWSELNKKITLKEGLTNKIHTIESQLTALHKARRLEQELSGQEQMENDSKRKNNKRTRRTAEQIERKYYCQAEYCDRCYGSEGSLQQHIKLKHPELYKKDELSEEL